MSDVASFYDGFALDYELAYGDRWDAAVDRQGEALERLLPAEARDVLDCSCGIGTQAIGLARRGFHVVGTDLSPKAVERARAEASRLGADVTFAVADFRDLSGVEGAFDAVISCDNAIPHLLAESEIRTALAEMRGKLRPGGLLVVTMRDFDRALVDRPTVVLPIVVPGPPQRVLVRLHEWEVDAPIYTVRYLILEEGRAGWTVKEHRTAFRAVTRAELAAAAADAGFTAVAWSDIVIVGGQQVMTARAG